MEKKYRVIVAGCRYMDNFILLSSELDFLFQNINIEDLEIISGGQQSVRYKEDGEMEQYGADYLGELYANARGIQLKKIPADWNTHGKSAGPIRNRQMAEYATHLIAFPSENSKGTRNMISHALKQGLRVSVQEI